MHRLAIICLALVVALPGASAAVDLNGRWLFEISAGPGPTIVTITQTGSALSIPWILPFTGSVDSTDPNGFTGYSVTWTDGVNQAGFGGRIMPSGNLLDGRAGAAPPYPPPLSGVVATRCTCFDTNSVDGDGCDAKCQVEPCWTCVGDPSVCTPTSDGGSCEDGSPCTTGETCTAGVCGGGAPVTPCFDMNGPWSRHYFAPAIDVESHTAGTISQRGSDLRVGSYVGVIDPLTGEFDIRVPNLNFFCWGFDPLTGSVAADGLTYSASGFAQLPEPFAPDVCFQFSVSEIGDHCGDGDFDGAEQCDDGNLAAGDGCSPLCAVEQCWTCMGTPSQCTPVGGGSCDDGDECTVGDTCAGDGSCGGSPQTCEPCFSCQTDLGCVATAQASCKASTAPEKSILYLKDNSDSSKDRFVWRWNKGADTTLNELGNPPGGDAVTLCVYDESTPTTGLLFRTTIPGGALWNGNATGFLFKDASAGGEGASLAHLKSGVASKAKAKVKGKGIHLSDRPYGLPAPALPLPLRVQLQGENGLCLETRHDASSVLNNDPARGLFKARGTP